MSIHRSAGRGFTLIELLVVIGIVGILVALAITIGAKVTSGGKSAATEQVLRGLDMALKNLESDRGGIPAPTVLDPRQSGNNPNNTVVWPIADALWVDAPNGDDVMINSCGLFIAQCKGTPSAEGDLRQIDQKFLRTYDPDGGQASDFDSQPELLTAFDGWGNPIRYVHPTFHGIVGQGTGNPPSEMDVATLVPISSPKTYPGGTMKIRRGSVSSAGTKDADSDGGLCPGNRPYFYSCGADGDPSTVEDNIYIARPTVQKN